MAFAYQTGSIDTIRKNAWNTIAKLINDNVPNGWTVTAAFPEKNPTYPVLVIHPVTTSPIILGLDSSSFTIEELEIEIEFFSKASTGFSQLDTCRDAIQAAIMNNQSTLSTYNLYLKEEPFDDSDVDSFELNDEKLNSAGTIIRMGLNT